MVLTNCAVCAAPPLAHNPPRCRECETTFCSVTCYNHYHGMNDSWRFYLWRADEKYKEAVAVAVEACADDTKGQTCYICTEGVKRRTGEGLVNAFCACRGGSSFAHVSCLAEQAKILVRARHRRGVRNNSIEGQDEIN